MKKVLIASLLALSTAACQTTMTQTAEAGPINKTGSVKTMVTQVAKKYGVKPEIVHAVVQVESTYNPQARNGIHKGLMQLNPRTARGVGVTGNLYDPATNLEAGVRYLKQGIDKYGLTCGGISSYNTGHHKTGYCTSYGRKVLAIASRIRTASID